MSILEAILLMCGAVLVLMGISAVVIRLEKRFPSSEYDERQKQARGNAYRFSFWIGIAYHFVLSLVVLWVLPKNLRPGNVYPFFQYGLALQAFAFYIYSIFTNAALPMAEKPERTILFYTALAVWNLIRFMGNAGEDISVLEPGPSNLSGLMTGFFFLILVLLHSIQLLKSRREDT